MCSLHVSYVLAALLLTTRFAGAADSVPHPAPQSVANAEAGGSAKVNRSNLSKNTPRSKKHDRSKNQKTSASAVMNDPNVNGQLESAYETKPGSALYLEATVIANKLKDDANYKFESQTLANSSDAFQFAENFPEYYFRLVKENQGSLKSLVPAMSYNAWCMGQAFPDNFSALIRGDAAPIFTVTQVENAGPCPLELDLFQLIVGAHFYDSAERADLMVKSYLQGLNGQAMEEPHLVQDLMQKSLQGGMLTDLSRISQGKLLREPGYSEVSARERAVIQASLDQFFPRKINVSDALETRLKGAVGVSSDAPGPLVYELVLENRGQYLEIELQQETLPATIAMASSELPALADRMTTVFTVQRGGVSIYEGALSVGGQPYLIRPHFNGDIALKIAKVEPTVGAGSPDASFDDVSETRDLIQYEAYVLGQLHAKTLNEPGALTGALKSVNPLDLARDATAMVIFYEHKFAQLTSPKVASAVAPIVPVSANVDPN